MPNHEAPSVSADPATGVATPAAASAGVATRRNRALTEHITRLIDDAGGWLPFDRFMACALYAPGLGYYAARGEAVFGTLPTDGSDFVTAPELSPLFGRTLAVQVQQALVATGVNQVWEFGAGTGALAEQVLQALDAARAGEPEPVRYTIVELSAALQARQRERLARFGERVRWVSSLPDALQAVVIGNEVLDAMPVQLIAFDGARWLERGVVRRCGEDNADVMAEAANAASEPALGRRADPTRSTSAFIFADRPTELHPPVEDAAAFAPGTVTELHAQAEAFIRTLASRLQRGAAFFIDYGFPDAEYYHPQRTGGTLMCHRAHRMDDDPLADVGEKDITAHVNFSGLALAAQDAGLDVLGYTSQARFLFNLGFMSQLQAVTDPRVLAPAQKLIAEHEMGELFKVIGFAAPGQAFDAIGFAEGDRSHRL